MLSAKYGVGDRTRVVGMEERGSWWWRDLGKISGGDMGGF